MMSGIISKEITVGRQGNEFVNANVLGLTH
jgi:hypothetical protein